MDPAHLWSRLQAELRRRVPDSTFGIWLEPLQWGGVEEDRIVLLAPAEVRTWVQDRLGPVLQAAATAAADGASLRVEVRETPEAADRPGRAPRPAHAPAAAAPRTDDVSPLNPKFTFGQFVIGDANRFAHAAALAVAESPAQAYNPLFIVGPPGVGKTHLLHSIGNYVRAYGGGLTVRYTTVEQFTSDFVAAVQTRATEAFKARYRRNDVLLIDDVQFLESKLRTEEELFHTFNALHETGSQLVLSSDRPPRDMEALQDRLRQRFEAGLLVDIAAPDPATRLAVLRKRAHHDGVPLAADGVLELIAERVTDSIRALEAALIRVVAYASLTDAPIDRVLTEKVLTDLYGRFQARAQAAAPPSVERIQDLVAQAYGLTREELVSPSRVARIAWPRQLAMYLAREHTRETLPAIGASFGGRDHTTVLHACRRAARRLGDDPEAFATVRAIAEQLAAAGRTSV